MKGFLIVRTHFSLHGVVKTFFSLFNKKSPQRASKFSVSRLFGDDIFKISLISSLYFSQSGISDEGFDFFATYALFTLRRFIPGADSRKEMRALNQNTNTICKE